jgi:hypothetical protein
MCSNDEGGGERGRRRTREATTARGFLFLVTKYDGATKRRDAVANDSRARAAFVENDHQHAVRVLS